MASPVPARECHGGRGAPGETEAAQRPHGNATEGGEHQGKLRQASGWALPAQPRGSGEEQKRANLHFLLRSKAIEAQGKSGPVWDLPVVKQTRTAS